MKTAEGQTNGLKPRDAASLARFKEIMGSALQQAVAAQYPDPQGVWASAAASSKTASSQEFWIGRRNEGDRVPVKLWAPKSSKRNVIATLLIHPEGKAAFETAAGAMVSALVKRGHLVLSVDTFNTGTAKANRDMSDRFFTTYNRTDDANRVQDILTAIAYLKTRPEVSAINLVGLEKAGLWCLLARALAPEIQSTVADASQFKNQDDQAYLDQLYIPLIRRAGDFRTALTIAPATRLLIHNTGSQFETEWVRNAYQISKAESALRIESGKISDAEMLAWLK